MAAIHPTAIVEPGARLGEGVAVGPYCVVGAEAELAAGVRLVSHVVVAGRTALGPDTTVYPFASLGHPPQDLKYAGEPSRLLIGRRNTIREHVTMNPGTVGGGMETVTGDDCLFMVGAHVAHDCRIGDRVVMANNATLAGHVEVQDDVVLGGLAAVHQFVRIGAQAMVGGMSGVEHDVPPFAVVAGNRARIEGLNIVGLRRRGFPRAEIDALRGAFRFLVGPGEGDFAGRVARLRAAGGGSAATERLLGFLAAEGARGVCRPARTDGG
ncbi:MAG: acyl-ACP--UDP-N-acetylglucosamine O-acyltransferase [Alphaproteobacteria bacterium]